MLSGQLLSSGFNSSLRLGHLLFKSYLHHSTIGFLSNSHFPISAKMIWSCRRQRRSITSLWPVTGNMPESSFSHLPFNCCIYFLSINMMHKSTADTKLSYPPIHIADEQWYIKWKLRFFSCAQFGGGYEGTCPSPLLYPQEKNYVLFHHFSTLIVIFLTCIYLDVAWMGRHWAKNGDID